jgi:hypothetical protein
MLSFDIGVALKKSGSSLDAKLLEAFIRAESGGKGFDSKTGKILIQFEPSWYRKKAPYAPSGAWSVNQIEVQSKEWLAFNNAFNLNPVAAMESTSIGLPQIMGFHWDRLGYNSVGHMWDSFKESLIEQICALIRFIETDKNLLKAFQEKDYHRMAYFYNGAGYAAQAHRLGIKPYNEQIRDTYQSLLKV